MTSEELADEVDRIVKDAQSRILGVGAEQYTESEGQRFELMPLMDLIEYVREEALDLINYGVMLTIRIDRLAEHVRMATQVPRAPMSKAESLQRWRDTQDHVTAIMSQSDPA